jgi:hypothetical protein
MSRGPRAEASARLRILAAAFPFVFFRLAGRFPKRLSNRLCPTLRLSAFSVRVVNAEPANAFWQKRLDPM